MRVAAALDEQAALDRHADGMAEIDPGDRAARAGADAVRLEGDGDRRAMEAVLEARGDQPDDAGMPARARRDDHRRAVAVADLGLGLGDRPPRASPPRSPGARWLRRSSSAAMRSHSAGIVAGKQPGAERGVADPPAGIDARAEHEAEMIGRRRAAEAGDIGERGEAGVAAAAPWSRRPLATKARFSPVSGTTSQTVPSATRSSQTSRSGSGRARHTSRAGGARG